MKKMTVKSKWITVSIVVMLVLVSVLSGCSGGNTQTGESPASSQNSNSLAENQPSEPSQPETRDPITIEFMKSSNAPPASEPPIVNALKDKLNIELELTASGDFQSQFNLRLASGDAPDIVQILDPVLFNELASRDVFMDLTPYKDQFTEVKNLVGDTWDSAVVNGKLYGLVNGASNDHIRYFTYWIRKDWLDHLNLPVPTNYDELFEVAQAFTLNDPNGNEKNDTYGLTGISLGAFAPIFGSYGVPNAPWEPKGEFFVENGELRNSLYAPGMKEALNLVNQFISSGVVDPDILINKNPDIQRKAFQGSVGIVFDAWSAFTKEEFAEEIKAINPDAEWIQLPAFSGPYGRSNLARDVTRSPIIALSKDLANEPEKLNRVIELLNFYASPEGSRLVHYGIEDKHYTIVDGAIVATELGHSEGTHFFIFSMFGRDDEEYLPSRFYPQKEYIDFALGDAHAEIYTSAALPPEGFNLADANRFIYEELVKFVYGRRAIDQYDAFLNQLEETFNYKLYLEAAEQRLTEMGYVK